MKVRWRSVCLCLALAVLSASAWPQRGLAGQEEEGGKEETVVGAEKIPEEPAIPLVRIGARAIVICLKQFTLQKEELHYAHCRGKTQ